MADKKNSKPYQVLTSFEKAILFILVALSLIGFIICAVFAGLAWNTSNKVLSRYDSLSLSENELTHSNTIQTTQKCQKSCDLFFCVNRPPGSECEDFFDMVIESCPNYETCIKECTTDCPELKENGALMCFDEDDLDCITSN